MVNRAVFVVMIVVGMLFVLSGGARPPPRVMPRMRLVHILNSPNSPHYNETLTPSQRIATLTRLDRNRHASHSKFGPLTASKLDAQGKTMQYGGGIYTIQAALGNNEEDLLADTGSDLLWFRCSQYSTPVLCSDDLCQYVPGSNCQGDQVCPFKYGYVGGDSLAGTMVYERVVVDGVEIPRVAIGCADQTQNTGAGGILGLGRGPLSIVSQAADMFDSTYSYCLADRTDGNFEGSSYLNLGRSGAPMIYTPMVEQADYRVQVEQIEIGGQAISVDTEEFNCKGGTVFDSGSTMTYLPRSALNVIWETYDNMVQLPRVQIDGSGACYDVSGLDQQQIEQAIPGLSFRFAGDVVFNPPFKNLFVDSAENVKCLGFLVADENWGFNLLGNLVQQGFHIENDMRNNRIGISYTACR